jgi:ubiquinone/menaquinone biosynthesis C-methylase UbiE
MVCVLVTSAGCGALKQCAYEGFGRDSWQHPAKVIEALDIEPGDHVADLGAGSGYFTFLLAQAVGPGGKVYAVDVDRDMVALLSKRVQEEGYKNVEVILADPDDPHLPRASLDLIFTCNVYHHVENRSTYFSRVAETLKPDGRVAVIDFSGEGWFAWLTGHATPADVIEREMKETGYTLTHRYDFLPKQAFLTFIAR